MTESYWAGHPTETCSMDETVTLKVAEGHHSLLGKAEGQLRPSSLRPSSIPTLSRFLKRSSRRPHPPPVVKEAHYAHTCAAHKVGIYRYVCQGMADRPSVVHSG